MRRGITLLELLVVITIICLMMGLLMSGVQKVRSSAAMIQCRNSLRQVGLATHHLHDVLGSLPPGHRSPFNQDIMPLTGWGVSLLPYLEQESLSSTVRPAFRKSLIPFDDPPHVGMTTVVRIWTCPSDSRTHSPQFSVETRTRAAMTSYLGVAGESAFDRRNGVFYQNSQTRFSDCSDGLSQTLMFGERPPSHDFRFGWWYAGYGQEGTGSADMILGVREPNRQPIVSGGVCGPGRYRFGPSQGFSDPCGMFHFWSPHSGGAHFALADGSARFITYSAVSILTSWATRNGGEVNELLE